MGDIVVDDDVSPTFNISYFITDHISTELLAAWRPQTSPRRASSA